MRRELSEFGGLQLGSCLLSRWRKLEGIRRGQAFQSMAMVWGVTKLSAGCQEDSQAAELSGNGDGQSACVGECGERS